MLLMIAVYKSSIMYYLKQHVRDNCGIVLFCADKLVFQLSQELKRLQRRKAMMSGEGSSSQTSSGSGPGSPGSCKEQPLFTLKQVSCLEISTGLLFSGSWFQLHICQCLAHMSILFVIEAIGNFEIIRISTTEVVLVVFWLV